MESGVKEEVIELLEEREKITKKLRQIAYDIAEKDGSVAEGVRPSDIAYKQILRTRLGVVI